MPLNVDKISTGSLSVNGIEIDKNTAHYELDITLLSGVTVNTTPVHVSAVIAVT